MTEGTFFQALRDHLPSFSVKITYNSHCPLTPFCVEVFYGKESSRCAAFSIEECFTSLLYAMAILPGTRVLGSIESSKTP